jgi:hypothetical protein
LCLALPVNQAKYFVRSSEQVSVHSDETGLFAGHTLKEIFEKYQNVPDHQAFSALIY